MRYETNRGKLRRVTTVTLFFVGLLFAGPALAQVESYTVGVDGMACPFCAYGIEKKLKGIDGVESLDIHIKKGTIDVQLKQGKDVTPNELRSAVKEAGFQIRDLHLRGEATIEERDGSAIARFSDEFQLPIRGEGPKAGKRNLRGEVVRKRGTWRLAVTEGGD